MLQRLREGLTLVFITLLPFKAFLVTIGTKIVTGENHAPLAAITLWKECLLAVILFTAVLEILALARRDGLKTLVPSRVDLLVIGLFLLSIFVTLATHRDAGLYVIGFKYDFLPLIAFVIARRVRWSQLFLDRVRGLLLIVGSIVAGYGLLSFFLPTSFFTWLGYSDLHSLYVPDRPIAAFQQLGGMDVRRIQSVMSGPNQLGLWLLMPWAIALLFIKRIVRQGEVGNMLFLSTVLSLVGIAMILTFSRSAWIAAAVMTALIICTETDMRGSVRAVSQRSLMAIFLLLSVILVTVIVLAPAIVVRMASSQEHFQRTREALSMMKSFPMGRGMGAAGPASNRVSDACVFLPAGADPAWAKPHDDLCVYVGETQVQPTDRACRCPLLPENWYLQIGLELGWIGMALFIAIVLSVLVLLPKNRFVFFAFLGVSIAALFLHAWESSAVAYTLWLLSGAMISMRMEKKGA